MTSLLESRMRVLLVLLLWPITVACASTAISLPEPPSPPPLATSLVPDRDYSVLLATLTALLPELQRSSAECLVVPETTTSLTGTPPQLQYVVFLRQRFEAACRYITCPPLPDALFESFVELNQQRFRVASDAPFPQGFRLIPWSPNWRDPVQVSDCYHQSAPIQQLAFSRVAISSDDSVALHYLEVRRCGFAWGEYVLLVKEGREWKVLSEEWLWSAG